jgi:hypothetical protein
MSSPLAEPVFVSVTAMTPPTSVPAPRREHAVDAVLWALTIGSAGLTLWLSLGPVPPGTEAFPGADKVFHGAAYFVTTLLFLFAAVWRPGRGPGPLARFGVYVVLAIVAAGLVVEVLQGALTDDREPELADWLAEVLAVIAALAIQLLARRLAAPPIPTSTIDEA